MQDLRTVPFIRAIIFTYFQHWLAGEESGTGRNPKPHSGWGVLGKEGTDYKVAGFVNLVGYRELDTES